MKKVCNLYVVLVLILVSGCATSTPDWVTSGSSKNYNTSQYVTAVAEGSDAATAGEQARIKIEKLFRSRFDYEQLAKLSLGNITIDGKPQNLHARRAEEIINDRFSKLMGGIHTAETWTDPKTKKTYALAVLSRAQAVAKLNEELYNMDRSTQYFLHEEKRKSDTLEKLSLAAHAIDTQIARRSLTRTLQDIDRRGKAPPPRWRLGSLSASIDGLLLRVHVSHEVTEDPTKELGKSLVDALKIAGFYIETSARPEFVMRGSLELSDGGEKDGWKWLNGVVEIKLVEARTGRNRGKIRWSIQAAGKTAAQAQQRIVAKVDSLLKAEMRGTIVKFATN